MPDTRVAIPWRDLEKIAFALSVANKLLNEDAERFAGLLDQNPMGVRDLVYSAHRIADTAMKKQTTPRET